jgi:hypothetical protein
MWRSSSELWASNGGGSKLELSLKALALDGDLAEGLAEEVLASVSATMASIPSNRKNNLLVFFLICEDTAEAVRKLHKVTVLDDS